MKRKDKIAVSVIAVFAVGVLVYLVAPGVLGSKHQTTNDAFVAADFTLVAPRVAGLSRKCWWKTTSVSKPGNCWR